MPVTFDVAKELAMGSAVFSYRTIVYAIQAIQNKRRPKPKVAKFSLWYC